MSESESFEPTLLIIAAGLAKRYGSLKQIDRIGPNGERIIDYSLYDAVQAGFNNVVYVIRKSFVAEFKEVILDKLPSYVNAQYVFQELDSLTYAEDINFKRVKPWGTGHALLAASSAISSPFVVINADDFYGRKSYELAYDFLKNHSLKVNNYALIGFELGNTMSAYGSVSRAICTIDDREFLTSIVERPTIKWENDSIVYEDEDNNWYNLGSNDIVSMNMFAFMPTIFDEGKSLFSKFLLQNKFDLETEFYLPSIVDKLIKSNSATVKILKTPEKWFGLTYKKDKPIVKQKILELIEKGIYPKKLWKLD